MGARYGTENAGEERAHSSPSQTAIPTLRASRAAELSPSNPVSHQGVVGCREPHTLTLTHSARQLKHTHTHKVDGAHAKLYSPSHPFRSSNLGMVMIDGVGKDEILLDMTRGMADMRTSRVYLSPSADITCCTTHTVTQFISEWFPRVQDKFYHIV